MTGQTSSPGDQYAHLRANAAAQKRATVDRLSQAITQLEAEGRPVNTFTMKEVSGLDYMAYYRNRDAFQLFQEHSTHLRKEREQKQAKHQEALRRDSRKTGRGQTASHTVKVPPRDPLLDLFLAFVLRRGWLPDALPAPERVPCADACCAPGKAGRLLDSGSRPCRPCRSPL